MKRTLIVTITALLVSLLLNSPALAQEATVEPVATETGGSVPEIEIVPVLPVEDVIPTDVAESVLDTVTNVVIGAAAVVVAVVLASVAGLVVLSNINAKAVSDAIPYDLAMKWLGIGEIGARLTPDTKDDAEIAAAKQKLIAAYGRLTDAVEAQAADLQRDASTTPRG